LSRRWSSTKKTANACHPGVINTNLTRQINIIERKVVGSVGDILFLKSIPQGAATQCYLAANPDVAGVSGRYYADCNEARCRADGDDAELAGKLWECSEKIVAALPT